MTISYILDVEAVFIRILTKDKYTIESFTDFPISSTSLREFWGRRYNHFVDTIFKESIFEPICKEFSSSTIGGLITFIVSGLLHIYLTSVLFNDYSFLILTFLLFFLHGLVCCFEANIKVKLPHYIGWLTTHLFLLLTTGQGSTFILLNPPPLIDSKWIPKLFVPNFCP
ncbi:hypothetical protein I4U23_023205 [Adineta vaga]|nr:hypothetical protein I4U23_023205 [Adineta vaga]